jgi:hypothetical protein
LHSHGGDASQCRNCNQESDLLHKIPLSKLEFVFRLAITGGMIETRPGALLEFAQRVENRVKADRIVTAGRGLNGSGMMLLWCTPAAICARIADEGPSAVFSLAEGRLFNSLPREPEGSDEVSQISICWLKSTR